MTQRLDADRERHVFRGFTKDYNIGYMFQKGSYRELTNEGAWDESEHLNEYASWPIKYGPRGNALESLCKPYRADKNSEFSTFTLDVLYPGVYSGMGYAHGLKDQNDDFKTGFSFEYTTGLPYIPGSSLKGMLRSHFIGEERAKDTIALIAGLSNSRNLPSFDDPEPLKRLRQLEDCLFGNRNEKGIEDDQRKQGCVTFFDVFPVLNASCNNNVLMEADAITPHKNLTDNPVPIRTIKLRAGCTLRFWLKLPKELYPYGDDTPVARGKILELFKTLLVEWGLGAKTHTGYGNFKMPENSQPPKNNQTTPKKKPSPKKRR